MLAAASEGVFASTTVPSDRRQQPNVILISLDTTRADALGVYGNKNIQTPHMDGVGKEGVLFNNHVVPVPLTLPSHASLLTGELPAKHGIHDNGRSKLGPDLATLASILKSKGYSTAAFVSSIVLEHRFGLDRGFDVYDDRMMPHQVESEIEEYERTAEYTAEEAIQWMRQSRASPFFLFVHFYDPHAAYHPHAKYSKYANQYFAEIAHVDENIGRILEALGEERDNTIVAVTADHGEGLGEHSELTHGLFVYDSTLRVPLLLSGPGVPRGKKIDVQTRAIDVMPTLLALTGNSAPASIAGRSLIPLISGGSWTESGAVAESQYGLSMRWSPLYSVRNSSWKYIHGPKPELYNLAVDPGETKNVIHENKAKAHEFRKKALAYVQQLSSEEKHEVSDPELTEKLKSLGYLSGSVSAKDRADMPDPKDKVVVWSYYERALFQFYEGKPEEAVVLLKKALELDDTIAVLYDTLARLSVRGSVETRIQYLRKAAELEPQNPRFHQKLAASYRKINQFDSSLAEAELSIQLYPEDVNGWHEAGTTYMQMNAPAKAIPYFQKILNMDPKNVAATHQLGTCLRSLGDLQGAERQYRSAIELNPSIPDSYNALGVIYAQRKQYSQAEDLFEKTLKVNSEFVEAYFNLGMTYEKSGRSGEAMQAFRKFISKADPTEYASRIEKARRWIEIQSANSSKSTH